MGPCQSYQTPTIYILLVMSILINKYINKERQFYQVLNIKPFYIFLRLILVPQELEVPTPGGFVVQVYSYPFFKF